MLVWILYGLFVLSCVVLILAVLLQPGKADAGALFTSSVSSTAFGPRGTQTLLAKITIGAALTFMLVALMISFGVGGSRSVLETTSETPVAPVPQQQQQSQPAAPASNAATTTEGTSAPAGDTTPTQGQTAAPSTNANTGSAPATTTTTPATSATTGSSPQTAASPSNP